MSGSDRSPALNQVGGFFSNRHYGRSGVAANLAGKYGRIHDAQATNAENPTVAIYDISRSWVYAHTAGGNRVLAGVGYAPDSRSEF